MKTAVVSCAFQTAWSGLGSTSQDLCSEVHMFFSLQAKEQKETFMFESTVLSLCLLTPFCWVLFASFKWLVIFDLDCFKEYRKRVGFLAHFYAFFCPGCYHCLRLSHDFRIWACGLQGWAHYFAWAMGERTWQWARHGPYSHQVRSVEQIPKGEWLKLHDSSFYLAFSWGVHIPDNL